MVTRSASIQGLFDSVSFHTLSMSFETVYRFLGIVREKLYNLASNEPSPVPPFDILTLAVQIKFLKLNILF